MSIQRANRAYASAVRSGKEAGLVDAAALAHALGAWWCVHQGLSVPSIVSGARPIDQQRRMVRRWERGDRSGLAARPACRSWHTVGRAWDVDRSASGFTLYRIVVSHASGVRWGGTFGDPVHFDLPGPDSPPDACSFP